MSPMLMRSILLRGSGIQIEDSPRRFGWDSSATVANPVLTLDVISGKVKGARFETRGKGPEIKFNAADLWDGANNDITVILNFNDMSIVEWRTEGEGCNQSRWMSNDDLNVTFTKTTGERVDEDDLEAEGVGKFVVRLTMMPTNVSKMVLYGGIVPLTKDDLRQRVEDCESEINSSLVPTFALKLGFLRGKPQNG